MYLLWFIVVFYVYVYPIHEKVKNMNNSIWLNISNKLGLGGGFFTILYGWLSAAETAIFIGVVATVTGMTASLYFQRVKNQRDRDVTSADERRKEEMHQAKLEYYRKAAKGPIDE